MISWFVVVIVLPGTLVVYRFVVVLIEHSPVYKYIVAPHPLRLWPSSGLLGVTGHKTPEVLVGDSSPEVVSPSYKSVCRPTYPWLYAPLP